MLVATTESDGDQTMSDEQIVQLADAVAERLASSDKLADAVASRMNGQLSGIRKDVAALKTDVGALKTDVGEIKEIVSETASKVDQLTKWYQALDGRVTDLEDR